MPVGTSASKKADYMSEEDNPYYDEEVYHKPLTRENTLENQIWNITKAYTKGDWREFEYGVNALIPLLPKLVRDQFTPNEYDFSTIGIEKFYQLFTRIQVVLESDTNMIWKKKFIKTYD